MSSKRYPEEFKIEAVRQVTDRGHSVAQVADRLGVTTHSLYAWIRKFGPDSEQHQANADDQSEIRRLQKELKRVTEERDILKKAAVSSTGECNILHLSQNWAFTHGNDEGARVLSFTKARALA